MRVVNTYATYTKPFMVADGSDPALTLMRRYLIAIDQCFETYVIDDEDQQHYFDFSSYEDGQYFTLLIGSYWE